jgi:hypothetical protein
MDKYFLLTQDTDHLSPILPKMHPAGVKLSANMSRLEIAMMRETAVGYFDANEGVALDLLLRPAMLVSDAVKQVMAAYQNKVIFRHVHLFGVFGKEPLSMTYWIGAYPRVKCLSDRSEYFPNGMLKKPAPDSEKIPDCAFFTYEETQSPHLVMRMDLVESLLRRELTGLKFEEIERS